MAKKITNEDIDKRIYDLVGTEYKRVSDYVRGNQKVTFYHVECGETFETTTNHFIYDNRRCHCKINTTDPKDFAERFKQVAGTEYTQITPYIRSFKKIKILHHTCGTTFEMTPKDFLRGRRCSNCCRTKRKSTEQFSQEVTELSNGEYKLVSQYKNNRTKVEVTHIACGFTYAVTPKDFLRGNRCPRCKQSKGEQLVTKILDNHKIPYELQKGYEDLKNNGSYLRFDFYIPDCNLLIEYDGVQHFKPVAYFGGDKKLASQQRRDKQKTEYAEENHINLLRVNYLMTEKSIEQHIVNKVNQCKAEALSDRV